MKLTPGLKYLKGNDGFIYCWNETKSRRNDMTEFVAEGDEQQPVTELVEKKAQRKEQVKAAKKKAASKKSRSKKKAAPKVAKPEKTPVSAENMRPPGLDIS